MSYMTKIDGVPDSDDALPGMAFFAGTGPLDKTCGTCKHRGLSRQSGKGKWSEKHQQIMFRTYRTAACAMFKKLSGNYGPVVKKIYPACKYYEQKEK